MSYRHRARLLASAVVTTMACNSGAASEPAKPAKPHHDQVVAKAKGNCVVVYASDCPEGEPCPADTYGKESIDCPPSLASGVGVMRLLHQDGHCEALRDMHCPPGATCNPPPPEAIPCPARYRPKPAPKSRIVERSDGTCWETVQNSCPEGFRCNPPPPRRVDCPPDPKPD